MFVSFFKPNKKHVIELRAPSRHTKHNATSDQLTRPSSQSDAPAQPSVQPAQPSLPISLAQPSSHIAHAQPAQTTELSQTLEYVTTATTNN